VTKKNFLFFYFPLAGFLVIFFVFSSLNRSFIQGKVEGLVDEQLQATAGILKVNFSHFLEEGYTPNGIFDLFSAEENIYYMALLDENRNLLGWRSRFEGFLPLSNEGMTEGNSWILESPAGRIFNSFSSFSLAGGKVYSLYLGYSLNDLEEMMARSRKNFYVIFGIIFTAGILFSVGLYRLQTHYLEKKRELEEEKKEKRRYREISALTSGVAHEIKNPLNSLALLFEWLAKTATVEIEERISYGKAEIRKITRIIDQFSNALKPITPHRERFLLAEVISDVRGSLEKSARERGVQILFQQVEETVLFADKELIRQALQNIVANAVEASDRGEVLILAGRDKKWTVLSVQDSGRGMSEDEKKHIFEPFISSKRAGMGIGLYLVKKVIDAHEGNIRFSSEMGKGTTFTLEIPGG